MIEVSIEVGRGAACFSMVVRAESLRRAVAIVNARHPGSQTRVLFPIDPETFFVEDRLAAGMRLAQLEMPESLTG